MQPEVDDRSSLLRQSEEPEHMFQQLLDSAPVLVWAARTDKGCDYFNREWLQFTGRPLADELGFGWTDGVHPDDRDLAQGVYEQSFDRRVPFALEYRLRRHDGEYRWLTDRGVPRYGVDGAFLGYVGTCVDITDRRRALAEAHENYVRFRAVADYTYDWESWLGPAGELRWVNPAVELLTGYTASECLAMRDYPLPMVHPQDRDLLAGLAAGTPADATGNDLAFRVLRKDGDTRWAAISWQPVRGEGGESLGLRTSVRDITDRKRAEEELRVSEQALRAVFHHVQSALLIIDPAGRIVTFNDRVLELFRITCDDAIRLTIRDLVDDADSIARLHDDARERLAGGNQDTFDGTARRPGDGSRFPASFFITGLPLGGARHVLVGVRDVTEERRAEVLRLEHAREQAAREAAEADVSELRRERSLRDRFVFLLTHDLRVPLTAARSAAQLLLRRLDDPDVAQRLGGRVVANIDRVEAMVRNLLDANRIRAGQALPLAVRQCNLRQVVTDALDDLRSVHGDRFILHDGRTIDGYWDPDALRRVLENLANNAVKYGSPTEPVTVGLVERDDRVLLAVHNEGAPLGEDERTHLFQPFHRSTSPATGTVGWGLGLTLVKGIAEAHGGHVRVESSAGAGTTFTVELPRDARAHAAEEPSWPGPP